MVKRIVLTFDEQFTFCMPNIIINNLWRPVFVFLFTLTVGESCSNSAQKKVPENNAKSSQHNPKGKPPSSYSDTVKIDFSAAVFYSPDSLQLEKLRAITDSGPFGADMHEFDFLTKTARLVLNKHYPHLKIVDVQKARFVLFIKADNGSEIIDLNTKNDPYGLFAFNRKDPPRLMDLANIDSDLGFYFKNK